MNLGPVLTIAVAFVVAVLLVPISTALAHRRGAIVYPRSDRLSQRVVPTLGGLAIAGAFVVGSMLVPMSTVDHVALVIAVGVMVGLGLADDLATVTPTVRVSIEMVVAAGFVLAVTSGMDPALRTAALVVAIVAVPIAVNATNIVDNADGLAATLSLVTALTIGAVAFATGLGGSSGLLALVLVAACAGFLVFNLPPARVFMGDSGSLMLGFALSACSIFLVRDSLASGTGTHIAAAVTVPLAWSLQLGDLAMVFFTRRRRRVSPFRGGVDHTSHRLLAAGLGPRGMLALFATLAGAIGVIAVLSAVILGDYRLVVVVALVAGLLVAFFEAMIATRLPYVEQAPFTSEAPTAPTAPAATISAARIRPPADGLTSVMRD